MKPQALLPRTILVLLMTVFVGVVFHAPFSVAMGALFPSIELPIKAWKEILLVIATVLLAIEVTRNHAWRQFVRDKLLLLCTAYAGLHLILLLPFWQGVVPSVAGLMIDLRYMLFFVVVFTALRLYPSWRRTLLIGGLVTAFVSMVFALLQVTVLPHDILKYIGYGPDTIVPYLTVDRSYEYIRITGTFRGPNPLGAYAAVVLAAATGFIVLRWRHIRTVKWRMLLCALVLASVVALWFSYSRSALVAAVLAVGLVLVLTVGRKLPVWAWVSGAVVAGGIIGALAVSWQTPFVQQVLLHNNPSGGSSVSSNDEHAASLVEGTERMLAQPFGAGIGSTGSASLQGDAGIIIENQYLFVAHEVGWLGLVVFVWIFVWILWRLWMRRSDWLALGVLASGLGSAAIGILLPVWADDTVSIVWWGLAAIALATHNGMKQNRNTRHDGTRKQKTT